MSRWASPYALAFAYALGCNSGAGFPDAPPKMDASNTPGTFTFSWTLAGSDTGSGSDVTCDSVGATTVQVGIVDANTMSSFGQTFDCGLGVGASGALFPSTYNLTFELLGSAGVIATAPPQSGAVIMPNGATAVPDIVFDVP